MKIDERTLEKISKLARIEIREEEKEQLMNDMSAILNWVEKLNEVDTDGVEPITQMTNEINRFRLDEPTENLDAAKALKNAMKQVDGYFVAPKVIKKGE